MNKYNVGVIVGRFQTDEIHEAHEALIRTALNQCDRVIIFLGTSVVKDSDKNPLDFRTRELMVASTIHSWDEDDNFYKRVVIQPLPDMATDELWSAQLDRRIREVDPQGSVRLFAGRDSFAPHYLGRNEIIEIESVAGVSATQRRKEIANTHEDEAMFRRGVIHAKVNQWPKVHPTVDIAIIREKNDGEFEVLLGQKEDEVLWRLIGGFADPTDDSYEAAARREGQEETGGKYNEAGVLEGGAIVGDPQYVGSFKINDWRYAGERNKIITAFFEANYISGEIKPTDDIARLMWIPLKHIKENVVPINKGHTILLNALIAKKKI